MATRTGANGGGNWTANGSWVEGIAPTTVDDTVETATGGARTVDTGAVSRSSDFTNYLANLTHTAGVNWQIGSVALPGSNIALKMVATMTYTIGATSLITFVGTIAGGTITTGGKLLGSVTFNGVAGSWILQDTFGCNTTTNTIVTNGTLNSNSQVMNIGALVSSGAAVRSIVLDNSVVTLAGSSGTVLSFLVATNLTFSATGSIINITGTGGAKTFNGGGKTFGAMTYASTGTGALTITGANTFTTLTVSCTSARTLTLPAAVTTTCTAIDFHGIPGALLTVVSSTGGSAAVLSVAAGTVRFNHCSLKDLTCQGGATFEAYDCIDAGGNTGITFKKTANLATNGVG